MVRKQSHYDLEATMILLNWLVKLQPTLVASLDNRAVEAHRQSRCLPCVKCINIHHRDRSSGIAEEKRRQNLQLRLLNWLTCWQLSYLFSPVEKQKKGYSQTGYSSPQKLYWKKHKSLWSFFYQYSITEWELYVAVQWVGSVYLNQEYFLKHKHTNFWITNYYF